MARLTLDRNQYKGCDKCNNSKGSCSYCKQNNGYRPIEHEINKAVTRLIDAVDQSELFLSTDKQKEVKLLDNFARELMKIDKPKFKSTIIKCADNAEKIVREEMKLNA